MRRETTTLTTTARERAEQYRKEAQTCLDIARRMSPSADRARLVEMSQHWISLAEIAEEKAAKGKDEY